jgi:hypothetical protein
VSGHSGSQRVFGKESVSPVPRSAVRNSYAEVRGSADQPAAQIVIALIPVKAGAKLMVSSPAFYDGGDIPFESTQYRGDARPHGPENTGRTQAPLSAAGVRPGCRDSPRPAT